MPKKNKIAIKTILSLFVILSCLLGYTVWEFVYGANVYYEKDQNEYLYIKNEATFEDVYETLKAYSFLENPESFKWLAGVMNYSNNVHAGRYKLKRGMSNRALLIKLRSGQQDPIKIQFERLLKIEDIAATFSEELQCDYDELISLLRDESFLSSYGFTRVSVIGLFTPDTYLFNWNTTAHGVIDRMYAEYKKFWSESRRNKAKVVGLTPLQVITLASIVEQESWVKSERPDVAAVYLNRLKINMRLQADPTIKFIVKGQNIKRVLNKHLKIKSPYNTYLNYGLPPGPICLPTKNAIEAVLNPSKHDYLYFCANADFSGRHAFAKNHKEHMRNARAYQKALNARKVYN